MSRAGGVLGIIGGIFGLIAGFVTLFVGGVGSAFNTESSTTVVALGWGGIFFSILTLVFGAIAMGGARWAGMTLLVASAAGAALGGTLVAICLVIAFVGGMLATIEGRTANSVATAKDQANSKRGWLLRGIAGAIALVAIVSMLIPGGRGNDQGNKLDSLSKAEPSALSPNGELAEMFAFGSSNTDLQRGNKLKEINGQVVQWTLPVYEVKQDGDSYQIQTKTQTGFFGASTVGAFISVTPRSDAERKEIEALQTGHLVTFKGIIAGEMMRNLQIKPAILWSKSDQATSASTVLAEVASEATAKGDATPNTTPHVNAASVVAGEASAAVAQDSETQKGSSLCPAGHMIFSCITKRGKHVDACDAGEKLTYFYGKSTSDHEMSLSVPREAATTRQWDGMGSAEHYSVNIPNGTTTYSLYWSATRGPDSSDPISAGIDVIVNGKISATIECQPDTVQENMEDIDLRPEAT